ncbi:MAG: isoamylase early set domain-containing protein [Longimicrobiales bacterium]
MHDEPQDVYPVDIVLRERVVTDFAAKRRVLEAVRRDVRWPKRWARWLLAPREIVLTPSDAILCTLLLGSCTITAGFAVARSAGHPTPQAPARLVQFELVDSAARSVSLVGDFNDWDASATPLRMAATGDVWSVTVALEPGRYAYSFVVDGARWVSDPARPNQRDQVSSFLVIDDGAS